MIAGLSVSAPLYVPSSPSLMDAPEQASDRKVTLRWSRPGVQFGAGGAGSATAPEKCGSTTEASSTDDADLSDAATQAWTLARRPVRR